jgi:nondiscriminating aspartyl-tRNA synthetase
MTRGHSKSRSLDLPPFKRHASPHASPTTVTAEGTLPQAATMSPDSTTSPHAVQYSKTMEPTASAPAAPTGLLDKIKRPIRILKQNLVDSDSRSSDGGSSRLASPTRGRADGHANGDAIVPRMVELKAEAAAAAPIVSPRSVDSIDASMQSMASQDTIVEESEPEPANELYGRLTEPYEIMSVAEVAELAEGTDVAFRARINTQRRISAALDFILFRDQTHTIQGVLANAPTEMIKWVQHLPHESLVQVTGKLQRPPPTVGKVRSATSHALEVAIHTLHLVNQAHDVPFDNYKPVAGELVRHRMENRVLDLRHPSNQAIFRVRSTVTRQFRNMLDGLGFLEIQTPKLQPAATESGSQVFKVNYFGRNAFLAQSPQLAKQMAISADFGRVFEIGPVFRAENSNTHRHLTEYTGLDLEMTINQSHHELINVVDQVLKSIFAAVQAMPELAIVRERFPSTDLVWLEETLILPFVDGVRMLREDGVQMDEEEDLSTRNEIHLGKLVKAKYNTDYFILDKFPAAVRPFYTMRSGTRWTNSFDIFVRGQEICSGGQRIHDVNVLRDNMAQHGLTGDGMEEYLAAFEIGAPPHGGAGLGLERIVMLILELGDVRHTTLFHRDPKSLPARPPHLPHPLADTTRERKPTDPMPPLEDLIANYGDASNTSWLDERFEIWRHPNGAAIGYVRQPGDKLIIITGDPLCDEHQYDDVIGAFLRFVSAELHANPVWLLVSDTVQDILARKHGWRTLTCTEEQRVVADKQAGSPAAKERSKKQRRISRVGVKVGEVQPDDEFRARADAAIAEWKKARKGKQMHLTEIRPWIDARHRRYFSAEKDGVIQALVVLAQLSPKHGWQVKWALDFPGSVNGAVEAAVDAALSSVSGSVTFGAGASERLTPGANLQGTRAKFLAKTYRSMVDTLGVTGKNVFREKFGALGEEVYICYPRHGVGIMDLRQIVRFFED